MKKLTLLLLVFVVYSSLVAQTGSETATDSKKDSSKKEPDKIIVFDLKKWEATKSQSTTFKAGEKFSLRFDNVDTPAFKSILQSSAYSGKIHGKDSTKKFSAIDAAFISLPDKSKKAAVNLGRELSGFTAGDGLVLSVKRNDKDSAVKITVTAPTETTPPTTRNTDTPPPSLPDAIEIVPYSMLAKYISDHYSRLYRTDVGYKLPEDPYTIHLFLDQFGAPLIGPSPTGIQNKYHYMVHLLFSKNNEKNVVYYFNNMSGSLSDASVVLGGDQTVNGQEALEQEDKTPKKTEVSEILFNFFPTTDDQKFDISAIVFDEKGHKTPMRLASYSIKKAPYYSSAINISGVYSWLGNPGYQLVNSPVNPGKQTVKTTDKTTGLMVSVLYTIYWSPFSGLFKKAGRPNAPGRTFLDDSALKFVRKIYPSIGFGLKDQVFTNILAGFTYQPVRDIGIFLGTNIRKINTFSMPGFVEGSTDVTQDQFNFYQNKKWKSGWALGVVIDVAVFNKILGSISVPKENSSGQQ